MKLVDLAGLRPSRLVVLQHPADHRSIVRGQRTHQVEVNMAKGPDIGSK
jgi:hypothetical protein